MRQHSQRPANLCCLVGGLCVNVDDTDFRASHRMDGVARCFCATLRRRRISDGPQREGKYIAESHLECL